MNTIAAISTAQGIGGIGVVRISGEDALKIANVVFKPFCGSTENCFFNMKGYTAKYGRIIESGKFIDDAIALVFKAPHSYTGEDVIEISCHGGLYLTRRVLRAVLDAGATLAAPGEFTKRAFLNGKMDLSQAEAVMDLISAKGERANKLAFDLLEGKAGQKISQIKSILVDIVSKLSVWADYPEDDVPEIDEKMLKSELLSVSCEVLNLIKNYDACKILKSGVKTAIVGRPNVGKSTLMNCLAGHEKSIVTNIPGTTRDVIEETVMLGDIPLILLDTAGIRKTDDFIEKLGVEKAKKYIALSDITLLVLDASLPLCNEDIELLGLCKKDKTIVALNKCDLGIAVDRTSLSTFSGKIVELSAFTAQGIKELNGAIEEITGLSKASAGDMLISNERQLESVKKVSSLLKESICALESGVTMDAITVLLEDAIEIFMEITGENVTEAVISKVFSKFCVGK